MNFSIIAPALGALVLGCVIRYFLPYVMAGLQAWKESGWGTWPKFEPKYLSGFVAGLIGFGIIFATSQGAVIALVEMPFTAAVLMGYSGGEAGREVVKLFFTKLK